MLRIATDTQSALADGCSPRSEETEPLLLDSRAAAKSLGVSTSTLWNYTKSGEIPSVKIGRSVRYDPVDLKSWMIVRWSDPRLFDKIDGFLADHTYGQVSDAS